MNIKKNVATFAIALAFFCPVKSNDATKSAVPSSQQIDAAIAKAIEDTKTPEKSAAEKAVLATIATHENKNQASDQKQLVSLDDAVAILQKTIKNANKELNSTEKEILHTIISDAFNCVINDIQALQNHEISQETAKAILEDYIKSQLAVGAKFTINGITYNVVASKHRKN